MVLSFPLLFEEAALHLHAALGPTNDGVTMRAQATPKTHRKSTQKDAARRGMAQDSPPKAPAVGRASPSLPFSGDSSAELGLGG